MGARLPKHASRAAGEAALGEEQNSMKRLQTGGARFVCARLTGDCANSGAEGGRSGNDRRALTRELGREPCSTPMQSVTFEARRPLGNRAGRRPGRPATSIGGSQPLDAPCTRTGWSRLMGRDRAHRTALTLGRETEAASDPTAIPSKASRGRAPFTRASPFPQAGAAFRARP